AGASEGGLLRRNPLVIGGNDCGLGAARSDLWRDRRSGRGTSAKVRQLLHESAPVERQVGVFVVGADHVLGNFRDCHGRVTPSAHAPVHWQKKDSNDTFQRSFTTDPLLGWLNPPALQSIVIVRPKSGGSGVMHSRPARRVDGYHHCFLATSAA